MFVNKTVISSFSNVFGIALKYPAPRKRGAGEFARLYICAPLLSREKGERP